MTSRVLDLGSGLGQITVAPNTDWSTGTTRYHVTGTRVVGVFVLTPDRRSSDPFPSCVSVEFGEGGEGIAQHSRANRPIINGVTLLGGTTLDPDRIEEYTHHTLSIHRGAGPSSFERAPARTAQQAVAIIRALVRDWLARPDLDRVRHAAAVHAAARRHIENERQITMLTESIDRLTAARSEHERHLATLHELRRQAAERDASGDEAFSAAQEERHNA